jgi:endonuclease/exonuclease/phosphatase family metal-dependent hydrolase
VRLRVLTYNIKGHGSLFSRSHVDDIAEVIRGANADIAGLQEVHRRTWQARRRDQAAELERATGMSLFFGPSFGDARQDYGNAILTRGRIVDARVEPLPGTGEPRTLLASTVELDGFRLHAFVTHLAAWGRFGARARLMQAEAVAKVASQSELPFVLTGDFNSTPSSDELRVFHDGELVLSCFIAAAITHRATRKCLDYVFADRGWIVRDVQVLKHGPSDHWPVVAELERE